MVTSATSLRERSKQRRRTAIEIAALRLFAERGYEGTTLHEVAAEAEVAPRTLLLYFGSKKGLALATSSAAIGRLADILEAADTGRLDNYELEEGTTTSLLEVIRNWLHEEAQRLDPEVERLRQAMFAANPELQALQSLEINRTVRNSSRFLARELGVSADHPAVRICIAGLTGVLSELGSHLQEEPRTGAALEAAMTFLTAGVAAVREQRI